MIDGYEWQLDFHYRENGTGKTRILQTIATFLNLGTIEPFKSINAIVLDDYKFKVKIKLCDDKYVDSISCECGEQSCKHMAACLHLLSNEEVPDNENKFIEIEGSLDNLKDDELTNFVKNQLISDYNFYKEFKEEFKP